jgi:hypothetical protein
VIEKSPRRSDHARTMRESCLIASICLLAGCASAHETPHPMCSEESSEGTRWWVHHTTADDAFCVRAMVGRLDPGDGHAIPSIEWEADEYTVYVFARSAGACEPGRVRPEVAHSENATGWVRIEDVAGAPSVSMDVTIQFRASEFGALSPATERMRVASTDLLGMCGGLVRRDLP